MCACRLEEMQQTSANNHLNNNRFGRLEEYIFELENRTRNVSDTDDIYTQLAEKEKDLILAAELGKALLERNEELSRANERVTEDYTKKLEFLEQEKHGLRRKLESLEGEYEGRIQELQSDIALLRKELSEQQGLVKSTEKEKMEMVQELMEQNHRLTTQLKQSAHSEEQLAAQLQTLREQFNVRRSNLNDHVSQLEGLKEEINILSERKADLERRIQSLNDERENLSMSLEESSDRILMLEKQNKEQENLIRSQQRDIEELREANTHLQDKLDSMIRRSSSPSFGQTSIYNEIEMSSQSSIEDELRSLNGSQSGRSRASQPGSSIGFHGDLQDDEIECDDPDLSLPLTGLSPLEGEENWKFKHELIEIYHQLRRLCQELQRRKDSISADSGVPATPEEIHINQLRAGMLSEIIKELKSLLQDMLANYDDTPCFACQSIADERGELEKLRKEVQEKSEELKKRSDEVSELTAKLTIQDAELKALREERDQLRHDLENSNLAKDEIVKKAWDVRDQAVCRKNAAEIELAKTRIDVMHINSQLMEAIQQKIELSQQLEQWQVDMQYLLDDQVKRQLENQELEEKIRVHQKQQGNTQGASKGKMLLRLWR